MLIPRKPLKILEGKTFIVHFTITDLLKKKKSPSSTKQKKYSRCIFGTRLRLRDSPRGSLLRSMGNPSVNRRGASKRLPAQNRLLPNPDPNDGVLHTGGPSPPSHIGILRLENSRAIVSQSRNDISSRKFDMSFYDGGRFHGFERNPGPPEFQRGHRHPSGLHRFASIRR